MTPVVRPMIGFVGVGSMGGAIASNLLRAGKSLAVLDRAIQFLGGVGVSHERPLAEMYAYQRTVRIGEGADEVHRDLIARLELAQQRQARGAPQQG